MSKAILIVDMPRVCSECDLFKNYYDDEHEEWYYACALLETIVDSDVAEEKKCDNCPLKELPEKKPLFETVPSVTYVGGKPVDSYVLGWNNCINKI